MSGRHEYISAPGFSFWNAREAALADLKALPGLADRIWAEWRRARDSQRLSTSAALAMRPTHREETLTRFEAAFALAAPIVRPHFQRFVDAGNEALVRDEVRAVVVDLCGPREDARETAGATRLFEEAPQ